MPVLEMHEDYVEWSGWQATYDEACQILDALRDILDTGHALMAGEVLGESIWLLHRASRLGHRHFNDNYRGWDDDMAVGAIHFMPFLEAIYWLKRIAYNGWISLDIFPYREDPDLVVTGSIAYLKRLDEIVDEIGLDTITELLRQNDGALTLRVINRHVLGTK